VVLAGAPATISERRRPGVHQDDDREAGVRSLLVATYFVFWASTRPSVIDDEPRVDELVRDPDRRSSKPPDCSAGRDEPFHPPLLLQKRRQGAVDLLMEFLLELRQGM